ncbi:MAG: hypothetical protein QOF76_3852 [Solirubrobacteraceae bacterium]|jgi:hypothetical protein|nr:hypothetical protein [Solirubrobacteraceae bacterium]
MDLLRHWRRRTFGAAAGALIVPVAIVAAALAVGLGGGGLGGLASIGQALNGPKLPSGAPSTARAHAGEAGRILRRVRGGGRTIGANAPAATSAAPATGAAPGGGSNGTPGGVPTPNPTATTGPVKTPTPGRTPVPIRTPIPTQATAPPPVVASTPTPSVIRQVGDSVKGITNQVPVVNQPAGQVVDLLVQTVEGLQPSAGG